MIPFPLKNFWGQFCYWNNDEPEYYYFPVVFMQDQVVFVMNADGEIYSIKGDHKFLEIVYFEGNPNKSLFKIEE